MEDNRKYKAYLTKEQIVNKYDYVKEEEIKMTKAFLYLDLIRDELMEDLKPDEFIEAIEIAQKIIMTKVTKFSFYL